MRYSQIVAVAILITCAGYSFQAVAQKAVNPQCANMRDKIGCTCALENGGSVRPNGTWSYPNKAVDAFAQCKIRNGSK
jgi:hypothetical protein